MAMNPETAKYMLALDDDIQHLWKALEHHSNAAEHRERAREWREKSQKLDDQIKSYRSELASNIKNLNDENARYINVVAVIGYAAYFATWSLAKDSLGKEVTAFVGLMGMISVSTFVLWEMFIIMKVRLKTVGELGHIFQSLVSVEDFEPLRLEQTQGEAKRVIALSAAHRVVFLLSLLTACAGGFAMMHKLYMSL
ncbi:hypothetical protein QA644_27870 (plasmid) [Rhizobium sp. CC1099]|uniref:hypothetical protein n=1 Tax=Rhizobium sp. CC1099 TaxID=3039160 RepID=UPI0024B1756C|nr:hypothetical protein [Rhizobium sp. CC1099]WFU89867.1 hypothetical protein QA644_27870 [Rhizobium sp. CC1099]